MRRFLFFFLESLASKKEYPVNIGSLEWSIAKGKKQKSSSKEGLAYDHVFPKSLFSFFRLAREQAKMEERPARRSKISRPKENEFTVLSTPLPLRLFFLRELIE